jgi:hypothetical protein
MRVRTRNRLVIGAHLTIVIGLVGFGLYKVYQVEPKIAIEAAIVGLISFVISLTVRLYYIRALERTSKRMRDEAGLKREDLPPVAEVPIPLIPSPLLPKNKKELARAIFFVAMLLALLILGWTGMLKKWFGE